MTIVRSLDWKGILIHAAAGAAAGFIAFLFGWPLLFANAVFWIGPRSASANPAGTADVAHVHL